MNAIRKRIIAIVSVYLFQALFVSAAVILVPLTSPNDGSQGKDRYGSFSVWESSPFESENSEIWVGHRYDSSWASGSERQAYLQVDLANLLELENIETATLNLYVIGYDNTTEDVASLSHVNSSTADGNASQMLSSTLGTTHDIHYSDGTGWLEFDFTHDIIGDLEGVYDYAAFRMAGGGYRGLTFRSADYEDPDYRPYLLVTVPEPATTALLGGIAAFLFLCFRRRRRG